MRARHYFWAAPSILNAAGIALQLPLDRKKGQMPSICIRPPCLFVLPALILSFSRLGSALAGGGEVDGIGS